MSNTEETKVYSDSMSEPENIPKRTEEYYSINPEVFTEHLPIPTENPEIPSIIFPALSDLSLNPWTEVRLFSEIAVDPDSTKTIVFCDIDDTLLHHPFLNPNWTGILKLFFYIRNQQTCGISDEQLAVSESEAFLDEVLRERPILHSDREGFFGLAEKVDKIVFVTARPPESKEFTEANLRSIDVDPEKFEVHYNAKSSKGEYIRRHFDLSEYDSVIFIDDQPPNLESVLNAFSREDEDEDEEDATTTTQPKLDLYRFQRMLEDPAIYYPFPPGFPSWYKFDGNYLVMAGPTEPPPRPEPQMETHEF